MDFHRIDKEGFLHPSDLQHVYADSINVDSSQFSVEKVRQEAQDCYSRELNAFLASNKDITVYKKPWAMRERRVKIWNPVEQQYTVITLTLYKVGRKINGMKRKKIYTFTGTLVSTYGRYLRMDVFMFVVASARYKKEGGTLGYLFNYYELAPASCRKWANDLLLLFGVTTTSPKDIWDVCDQYTTQLQTSTDIRVFFENAMANVTRGTFASYNK